MTDLRAALTKAHADFQSIADAAQAAAQRAGRALEGDADPGPDPKPKPDPDPNPGELEDWTAAGMPRGVGPQHGDEILRGYMATTAFEDYERACGCLPDIGGGLTGRGDWTWESIMGGDYAKGPKHIEPGSMVEWDKAPNTQLMMKTKDCWVVPHGPGTPGNLPFEDVVAIAKNRYRHNGISNPDMIARRGERVAEVCRRAGKPLSQVMERPWHEFNGTTKFVVKPEGGDDNFWRVGLKKGYKPEDLLEIFQELFAQFVENTWKGAGQRVCMALSPQMQNPAGVPDWTYEQLVGDRLLNLIAMLCSSVHFNPDRAKDEQRMKAWIEGDGREVGGFTLGGALDAARRLTKKTGRVWKTGTLEFSPVHSNSANPNLFKGSMRLYPASVDAVYNFIEDPKNRPHMFCICMHAPHNCFNEAELNGKTSEENIAFWHQTVERLKARHRKAA